MNAFNAGERDDFAYLGALYRRLLQTFEGVKLRDLGFLKLPVNFADGNLIANRYRAVKDAANGETAHILVVIEIGHQHLQRQAIIAARRGDRSQDLFKERAQVRALTIKLVLGHAVARNGVEDGEFELLIVRIEGNEEIVNFVHDFLRAR